MTFPYAVVRIAARQVHARLTGSPGVLAVGVGFRHRRGRYVGAAELCVKVHVRRKHDGASVRVPRWVQVNHRGELHRVYTDVEGGGGVRLQRLPCGPSARGDAGTVFAFAKRGTRRFALTAGHVLQNLPSDAAVRIAGDAVGSFLSSTSRLEVQGYWLDLAAFALQGGSPAWHARVPWSGLTSVVATPTLWREFARTPEGPPRALVFAAEGIAVVALDTLLYAPLDCGRGETPPDYRGHAGPILGYRLVSGSLQPGYSGAAVSDATGRRLLGLHIGVKKNDPRYGYAQAAGRIVLEGCEALGGATLLLGS
jgi:hypothetical protein